MSAPEQKESTGEGTSARTQGNKDAHNALAVAEASRLGPALQAEQLKPVSDDAKNGLITAIGIILGFSFAFFGQWIFTSDGDGSWWLRDFAALLPFGIGAGILAQALYRSLLPYEQVPSQYERTARIFFAGVIMILVSIALALIVSISKGTFIPK